MADKVENNMEEDKKVTEGGQFGERVNRDLSDFISDEYEKQKDAGKMEGTENIDEERTANFFARAMGESMRMSAEAAKSQAKVARLYDELGREAFQSWRDEHSAQVLTPQQAEAVSIASQQNMDDYYTMNG